MDGRRFYSLTYEKPWRRRRLHTRQVERGARGQWRACGQESRLFPGISRMHTVVAAAKSPADINYDKLEPHATLLRSAETRDPQPEEGRRGRKREGNRGRRRRFHDFHERRSFLRRKNLHRGVNSNSGTQYCKFCPRRTRYLVKESPANPLYRYPVLCIVTKVIYAH